MLYSNASDFATDFVDSGALSDVPDVYANRMNTSFETILP